MRVFALRWIGFWGKAYNEYKSTTVPHLHSILAKWRRRAWTVKSVSAPDFARQWSSSGDPFTRMKVRMLAGITGDHSTLPPPSVSFIYSNTADASVLTAGAHRGETFFARGCIAQWQCATPCCRDIWTLPEDAEFHVSTDLRAVPVATPVVPRPATPEQVHGTFEMHIPDTPHGAYPQVENIQSPQLSAQGREEESHSNVDSPSNDDNRTDASVQIPGTARTEPSPKAPTAAHITPSVTPAESSMYHIISMFICSPPSAL